MNTDWHAETIFYMLDISGSVKIGITANLRMRLKAYISEIQDITYQIIKTETFKSRWEAELLEQVIKWRLRPWCYDGRHEWFDLPVQAVLDCYFQTREHLFTEINRFEYIHRTGNDRWGYYKQIADMEFDKHD